MKSIVQFALLFCVLLALIGCSSEAKKEPLPREVEQEALPVDTSADEQQKYRSPDGGFGALDHSRDIRGEAEAKQQESQQALEATE